jgi:hypothetical protein
VSGEEKSQPCANRDTLLALVVGAESEGLGDRAGDDGAELGNSYVNGTPVIVEALSSIDEVSAAAEEINISVVEESREETAEI